MIHEPLIEVTCDGESCDDAIRIEPEFMYRDYSGKNGDYDCSDDAIEKQLLGEGWVVEGGKHYCDPGCKP